MKENSQANMKAEVKDWHKPETAFAEKHDQSPLTYMERQDRKQSSEGSKLRSQAYKGRYSK